MRGDFFQRAGIMSGLAGAFIILGLLAVEGMLLILGIEPQSPSTFSERFLAAHPHLQSWCHIASFDEALRNGLIPGECGYLIPDETRGYRLPEVPADPLTARDFYTTYRESTRVLVLGDSFTQGVGAESGSGFVDLLIRHYRRQEVAFFNTGTGGYGQNNELATLRELLPIIKPHLILLGFYTGNDFWDNLTPVDRYIALPYHWVNNYEVTITKQGVKVRRREPPELLALYQRTIGCDSLPNPESSFFHVLSRAIKRTRVGTLASQFGVALKSRIHNLLAGGRTLTKVYHRTSYQITKQLFLEISAVIESTPATLWVLVIPDKLASSKTLQPSNEYDRAMALFTELHLHVIDLFPELSLADYGGTNRDPPSDHWTNSGHYQAFASVKEKLDLELPTLMSKGE